MTSKEECISPLFTHQFWECIKGATLRDKTQRYEWCLEEGSRVRIDKVEVVELSTSPANTSSMDCCNDDFREVKDTKECQ